MKKIVLFLFIACATKLLHSQNTNIVLAGHLSYGTDTCSNLWGWKNPADGKEYALVGLASGLSIVDVTNPANPVQIVNVPPQDTASRNCEWREVKTYRNYAYVTTECGKTGLQIVDLSNLPSPAVTTTNWTPKFGTDTLKTIHALHIDTTSGRIYLYGYGWQKGVVVADIKTNPMSPIFLANYDAGGYIHDGIVQGDTMYAGHIWLGTVEIADMTNPASPVTLANFYTPGAFTHNTWLSTDNKTLFTTDEVNGGYLASFDISNFGNISQLDTFLTDPRSGVIVHNTYIVRKNNNDYAVTSWYKDGIVITDAARPGNLVQVGNYDTSPLSGGGYGGCWGVYPYLPSGNILASDIETGLYVLTPTYTRACYLEGKITNCQNGNPVAGVKVEIQLVTPIGNSNIDITDLNGNYRVGIGAPGNYIVNYSKTGFINYSDTVSMSQGILNIHNVQLCPDGINEYENLAEVKISPNPFSEFAEMKITGEKISVTGSQLKIVDVYGKQMKTFRVESSSMKIERENFPAGMYFYSITNSGEIIARGKFMVE